MVGELDTGMEEECTGGNSAPEPGEGKLLRQDKECPQFSAFLHGWKTNNVVLDEKFV